MYWCQIDLWQVQFISVKFQLKMFVWFVCSLFLRGAFIKSHGINVEYVNNVLMLNTFILSIFNYKKKQVEDTVD